MELKRKNISAETLSKIVQNGLSKIHKNKWKQWRLVTKTKKFFYKNNDSGSQIYFLYHNLGWLSDDSLFEVADAVTNKGSDEAISVFFMRMTKIPDNNKRKAEYLSKIKTDSRLNSLYQQELKEK